MSVSLLLVVIEEKNKMVRVIVATTSDIKKVAFETSEIAAHLRAVGVTYEFVNCDCDSEGDEFAGTRWAQPFTASGGMLAAMQRISVVRGGSIKHYDELYYDESGMLMGVERKEVGVVVNDDRIIIAIESYITDNAKDCVCIVVNYYVSGEKRELVSFSPASYIATFPEKYLQHLAATEKYQQGVLGFKTTIGDVIELEKHIHGGGVSKNWHKLFNPFDRVEQIRGTLNYIADEFKKIVTA
jgi:hypothetical protein